MENKFETETKHTKLLHKETKSHMNEKLSNTTFDDLPDDCLTYIFVLLPIFDKIRIESVCKRFRDISRKSWYLFEKLDFSPETWGWPEEEEKCIDDKAFSAVLNRCRKYLTTIDLNTTIRDVTHDENGLYHNLRSPSIAEICRCPNMRCLYLNEIQIHPSGKPVTSRMKKYKHISGYSYSCKLISSRMIQSLMLLSKKLTHFSLNFQRHEYEDSCVSKLISEMKKLKMLHLSAGSKLSGEILIDMSFETIEELCLEECHSYWTVHNADLLNAVLERCKKLHTFVLKHCIQEGKVDLTRIQNLENLGLVHRMQDSRQLKFVPRLHNLKKLNVEGNNRVNDQFLQDVSKHCGQLVYLNISHCCNLSDKSLVNIGKLMNLEYLILNHTKLSSNSLGGASIKLKLLDCSNCRRISDAGLITLLQFALDLRVLILQNCPKVTSSLVSVININIATRNVQKDQSFPILTISNEGTMLDDWRLSPHVKAVKAIIRKPTYGVDLKDVYFHTDKSYDIIPYPSIFNDELD